MVVFPQKWYQHPHQPEFLNIRWFGRRLSHFSFKSGFAQKRIPKISHKLGSLNVRGFGHDLSPKNLKIAWNDFLFSSLEGEIQRLPFPFSASAESCCRPSSRKVSEKSVRELSATLNFKVSCLGVMASRSRSRAEGPHWFCWFSYMKNNKTKKAGIMWIKTFRVSCGVLRPPRQRSKVSKTFRTKFEKKVSRSL